MSRGQVLRACTRVLIHLEEGARAFRRDWKPARSKSSDHSYLLRDFDLAEVAVLLLVRTRREVQGVGWAGPAFERAAITEADSPQTVDDEVFFVTAQPAA